MPYILGLLVLIFGGFVFRKALIAFLGVVLILIALLGASFITFWASVLLLGRIDAIIAGGSGWFEIPACVVTWIVTFSGIWGFLLPTATTAKSKVIRNIDKL